MEHVDRLFAESLETFCSRRRAIVGRAVTKTLDGVDVLPILLTGVGQGGYLDDIFVRFGSPCTKGTLLYGSENRGVEPGLLSN